MGQPLRQHLPATPAAQGVDALESPRGHEPGAGVVGHPLPGPALEGGHEGFLQRLLGEVEIAQQSHQRRQHMP